MGSSSDSGSIPIDEQFTAKNDDDAKTFTSDRTMATTTTMFRQENGRTYHAFRDGEYLQPNDARHNNHEGVVHHLCILTLRDKLFLAPVVNPKHILDLGTGTGIWATDMADYFPDAQVTGVDLSPIQPKMQPSNCHFEIDDCASKWVYPKNHFDFVHIRGMFGSIADWPSLYNSIYNHLTPGGYIEQLEYSVHVRSQDRELEPDHTFALWGSRYLDIGRKIGKSFDTAETMADTIRAAGFVDVVEKRFKWPVGPWSSDPRLKEIGRWNLLSWEQGAEGWVLAGYTRALGWSCEDTLEYLEEVRKALRNRKDHLYHEIRLVYAKKPS